MNTAAATGWGEPTTLDFKGHPIRSVPFNGIPWFALPDMIDALGFREEMAAEADRRRFPAHLKAVAGEEPDEEVPGEPEQVTILSPSGVWWWTHFAHPSRGQALSAWAKRTALEAKPSVDPKDPYVFLGLLPDGGMPPYPLKYSGRKAEWVALRETYPCNPLWLR